VGVELALGTRDEEVTGVVGDVAGGEPRAEDGVGGGGERGRGLGVAGGTGVGEELGGKGEALGGKGTVHGGAKHAWRATRVGRRLYRDSYRQDCGARPSGQKTGSTGYLICAYGQTDPALGPPPPRHSPLGSHSHSALASSAPPVHSPHG
jgi:hypothetical protein